MKLFKALFLLIMAMALTGCASEKQLPSVTETTQSTTLPASIADNSLFSERDLAGTYDESSAVSISLNGTYAAVNGSGASVSGTTVTITEEGVYLLSGSLDNGQIIVDANKNDKIQLVLDNASITSQTSAPVYIRKADKVFITLADGSENCLENSGSYAAIDDSNIDSVIFSKADMTLNGNGELTILANAGHGIVSKDSLTIGNGIYWITAAEHGITAKDNLSIAAGSLNITAGEDGIHAKNSEDTALGNLCIAGGELVIESGEDAVFASGSLRIDGGSYRLTTGGGSKAGSMKPGDSRGGWFGWDMRMTDSNADTPSAKGIKSDGTITVTAGVFFLDTADDAVHAGGDILISGGDWSISTADDGIHADQNVIIQDGSFRIPYCYEGVEGLNVTVDGGTFDITSTDDGFNAAGGMDASSGFRAPGGSSNAITINGGSITIVSDGDSLDSNGSITLNGGKLRLVCNGNGNTAVDCDGNFVNNGADITTNDGSENGTEFGMHRGMGKFGKDEFKNMPDGRTTPRDNGGFRPKSAPGISPIG